MRLWEAADRAAWEGRAHLTARLVAAWPGAHPLFGSDGPRSPRTTLTLPGHDRAAATGTIEYGEDGREVYAMRLRYVPADLAVRIVELLATASTNGDQST